MTSSPIFTALNKPVLILMDRIANSLAFASMQLESAVLFPAETKQFIRLNFTFLINNVRASIGGWWATIALDGET